MSTWRHSRPARTTRRFSVSDSVSPLADGRDGVRQPLPDLAEVERPVTRAEDAEVLHPGLAVAALQAGRDLLDDAQAEVLQRRHRVAELDLPARLVERDARPARLVLQPDDERLALALQPLEALDVGDRQRGLHRGAVVAGEARSPACRELGAARRAEAVEEPLAQAVVPRAGERDQLLLEVAQRRCRARRRGRGPSRGRGPARPPPARSGRPRRRSRSARATAAGTPRGRRGRSARRAARRSARPTGCRPTAGRAAARGRPPARAARRPRGADRRRGRRTARPSGTSRTARRPPCSRASPRSGPRGGGSGAACG